MCSAARVPFSVVGVGLRMKRRASARAAGMETTVLSQKFAALETVDQNAGWKAGGRLKAWPHFCRELLTPQLFWDEFEGGWIRREMDS